MNMQSYVSLLYDICSAYGYQPVFNLISRETGNDMMNVTYKLSVFNNNIEAIGVGNDDITSKEDCSKAAISLLLQQIISQKKECLSGNIEKLNRYSAIRKQPDPVYKIIREEDIEHGKVFVVKCFFGTYSQIGVAETVDIAKHAAAKKMIELVDKINENNCKRANRNQKNKHSSFHAEGSSQSRGKRY